MGQDAPDYRRIAKTKSPMLGCVAYAEIRESRSHGGYIRVKTTGSKGLWVLVSRALFAKWAYYLRSNKEQMDGTPFTRKDAQRVIKWLRAKMLLFDCTVRVCRDEGTDLYYYDCSAVDLMEGEYVK
jgi:hypothetical protein